MNRSKLFLGILLIALVGLALAWRITRGAESPPQTSSANFLSNTESPTNFQRAEGPRQWDFPEDFGPHPDYQTEWWYYTGNLQSENGERFGYQLTFFRRALLPENSPQERDSAWAADQVYMAHFALTDISTKEHYAFERFTRGAAGLAGAQANPYQVWLENWEVTLTNDGEYLIKAGQNDISIELILKDAKGPIFHGDQGYSQKGPEKGNASYYFSQTRLESQGIVQVAGEIFQVAGLSWMDHEFGTSALSEGQVGWDWFSIQLEEDSELMVFQIRRADGSIDPFSSGTWINAGGKTTQLDRDQFQIQVLDTWQSDTSGGEYPAKWNLVIPSLNLKLEIEPFVVDQEMNVSYAYWEGAVKVSGSVDGESVKGNGYLEMTGYAASMEGEF
ncbi:MAG: hypothetical protein ISR58_15150 [Anaerolineales bacterium]|nr:hypothetical protein [Anaerolineales bacterium]